MGLITINISTKGDYHTQRNNTIYPFSSCGVTSMINALKASKIPFNIPYNSIYKQPEDYLSHLLDSPEAYKEAEKIAPQLIKKYEPRLIHEMLEWAVNRIAGYEADTFILNGSIQSLLYHIWINKCACVMDGKFTKEGHIICIVGFKYESLNNITWTPHNYSDIEIGRIESIIIDDSYGNFNTSYKDQRGDDVELSFYDFNKYTNELGNPNNKRMHVFRRHS